MSDRPTFPTSIRFTFEEKARLDADAAGMSHSNYIKWRLFDPASPPPRTRGKQPIKDHAALAAAMALLGQSRIANNLNQLARLANSGSLSLTPDTEAAIIGAATDVADIRRAFFQALNLDDSS